MRGGYLGELENELQGELDHHSRSRVRALPERREWLEGTCKAAGDAKGVDLTDGMIEAERVSWTWRIPVPDGVTWTFAFAGTLDANGTAMNGVVTLTAGPGAKPNEATFAARKE